MKKAISLFLVLILISTFAGCGTTASEETATTLEAITMSHEAQVDEFVQWAMVNIINKNSVERHGSAQLYEDVKEEVESYISTLPSNLAPTYFSVNLISPDVFVINISF